jgi:hypothetical protein
LSCDGRGLEAISNQSATVVLIRGKKTILLEEGLVETGWSSRRKRKRRRNC